MLQINDEELLYRADELEYRAQVREFVDKEIRPIVDKIESKDYDPHELFRTMAKSKLTGLMISEEYGAISTAREHILSPFKKLWSDSPQLARESPFR